MVAPSHPPFGGRVPLRQSYRERWENVVYILMAFATLSVAIVKTQTLADQTSATIIVALSMQINDSFPTLIESFDSDHFNILGMFIAAEMAKQDLMSQDGGMFGSNWTTEVKFVNLWDPQYSLPPGLDNGDSGGFATAAIYETMSESSNGMRDILGVIGDYYSRTTMFTARFLSSLEIPMCGATQTSLLLSNSPENINHNYFWRMQPSQGTGAHIVTLLQHWNAKRICILTTDEVLSLNNAEYVFSRLVKLNIQAGIMRFETSSILSSTDGQTAAYRRAFDFIRSTRCRYIVSTFFARDLTPLYFAAYDEGLVGKGYLWLGTEPPMLDYGNYSVSVTTGFIYIKPWTTKQQSESWKMFSDRFWKVAAGLDLSVLGWESENTNLSAIADLYSYFPTSFSGETYDCFTTVVAGLKEIIRKINATSPEQLLASRELIDFSAFRKTGNEGVGGWPVMIDSMGGVEQPMLVIAMNESNAWKQTILGEEDAFGWVELDASAFHLMYKPLFAGGEREAPMEDDGNDNGS
ncbi:hypothetical protein HDU97_005665 [Phlyctochytrium planicorne]|nr:hypothetical protein HDU97_005665 [Phlyctochytrium planicorne]